MLLDIPFLPLYRVNIYDSAQCCELYEQNLLFETGHLCDHPVELFYLMKERLKQSLV